MLTAKATDPNPNKHLQKQRRPLQVISQEDQFFSSLLSKEHSSMANPSFRVYYAGVAGSVPFIWESQPGTPKHSMAALFAAEESSSSPLPPLTPPPSSFRSSDERIKTKNNNPSLFGRLLVKVISYRKPAGTRSMLVPVKSMDYLRRRRFSSRGSSFDSVVFSDHVDDDEHDGASRHLGRFLCFGFGERTCRW